MINRVVMRSLRGSFVCIVMLFLISCGQKTKKSKDNPPTKKYTAEDQKPTKKSSDKVILCFGNSLTAGLGLKSTEAFPALIQNKIDSLGYDYKVVNAGLSGETTASGKNRINWVLKQNVDIFILELGANDGLRGIPLTETRQNLQDIIDTVKSKNPNTSIILAGMQIPPNMGQDYTSQFRNIFPKLAQKNDIALIPFLLEGVAGNPDLNQSDGIHPTAEGYEIVSDNVWKVLKNILEQ